MIFVNWPFWRMLAIAVSVVISFIWLVVKCLKWKPRYQVLIFAAGSPVAGVATLFLLFAVMGVIYGCDSHDDPVYSPNHTAAARAETWDAGGTGGGTNVRVFQKQGFDTQRVFAGSWKSVSEKDIRWLDDHDLRITFYQERDDDSFECTDAGNIHVHCIPRRE